MMSKFLVLCSDADTRTVIETISERVAKTYYTRAINSKKNTLQSY